VTKDGNAFQTRAPATGKERSPIVVLRVGGTTSACEDVDRSDHSGGIGGVNNGGVIIQKSDNSHAKVIREFRFSTGA